jgi:hypothetical protein
MTEDTVAPTLAEQTTRRFNVGDALILIAALCLGLSGNRDRILTLITRAHWWQQELESYQSDLTSVPPLDQKELDFSLRSLVVQASDEGQAWFTSVLVGLTPAQILLRLRRPRPDWRRLFGQPGFMASLAAAAGYVIERGWDDSARLGFAPFPFWTSLLVLAVWTILLGLKRCRAEQSWIDRLGRALGAGWILAGFWAQLEQYYFW